MRVRRQHAPQTHSSHVKGWRGKDLDRQGKAGSDNAKKPFVSALIIVLRHVQVWMDVPTGTTLWDTYHQVATPKPQLFWGKCSPELPGTSSYYLFSETVPIAAGTRFSFWARPGQYVHTHIPSPPPSPLSQVRGRARFSTTPRRDTGRLRAQKWHMLLPCRW